MPIGGKMYSFSEENVNGAPDTAGVYALFLNQRLTYIGKSDSSIRSRLQRHFAGLEGRCTQAATHYMREVTFFASLRERELLQEYVRLNGRLPACNNVMP